MMENGIYLEIFVMKNGKRYNVKTVSMRHLVNTLTNGMMGAIEELIEIEQPKDGEA